MRFTISLILCLCFFAFNAQEKEKKIADFSVRGNIGIPKIIGSQQFAKSFKGIYETNLSINFRMVKNLYAGVGYQNDLFVNNKNVFVQYTVPPGQKTSGTISYDTRMSINSGFIKVGYDTYFSDIGFVSYALNAGYMGVAYNKVIQDTSEANKPLVATNFGAPYVQPEISLNFVTEKFLSFSILFSYTTVMRKFDPKAPRFNQFEQIRSRKNNYPMNWINLGFGFAVLLD